MIFFCIAVAAMMVSLSFRCVVSHDAAVAGQAERHADELRRGNDRFVRNEMRAMPIPSEMRRSLSRKEASPFAVVVACNDCLAPAEDIFSQPPGRLYAMYTTGNTAGTQAIGSVQFALAYMNISVFVVLGHTRCGAIKTVVNNAREEGYLDRCYDPIRQAGALLEHPVNKYRDPVREWTIANVRHAADTFLKTNPLLARNVSKRRIALMEGVYDVESGVVTWLD